jgi:hypothetical protein
MKLNGWMRLWIVLSICWSGFVSYFAYEKISPIYAKKTFEVSKDGIGKAKFIFSTAETDIDIKKRITNEIIPLIADSPENYVDKTISFPYENHLKAHASSEITFFLKLALFPIFGAFTIGQAFVWIRSGFRNEK